MIKYYIKNDDKVIETDRAQKDCWINVYPPFEARKLEELSKEVNIPLDFLIDSIDVNERSRFEVDDDVKLIVINTPILNDRIITPDTEAFYITIPIGIILTDDLVITISPAKNQVIDWFVSNTVKKLKSHERDLYVLKIFEKNVNYFLHYLNEINNRRYLIEKELYNSSRNRELNKLLNIQKSLVYFVTNLRANELVMMKILRTDFLKIKEDEEKADILEDIIIDSSQALEMANVYTNILNGTMDAFASIISNNLNMIMKRLTSITVLLMVPTLVASFYGMNVTSLPLDNSPFGFFVIILLSVFISAILYLVFRKMRWF